MYKCTTSFFFQKTSLYNEISIKFFIFKILVCMYYIRYSFIVCCIFYFFLNLVVLYNIFENS